MRSFMSYPLKTRCWLPLVRRNPKALFVHTAGSMPMDVWKGEAVRYGVLYPMQTFSKSRAVDFSTVPFFIEGSGREEAEALKASYFRATPVLAYRGGIRL